MMQNKFKKGDIMIDLRQGDCLELMRDIPDKTVDIVTGKQIGRAHV